MAVAFLVATDRRTVSQLDKSNCSKVISPSNLLLLQWNTSRSIALLCAAFFFFRDVIIRPVPVEPLFLCQKSICLLHRCYTLKALICSAADDCFATKCMFFFSVLCNVLFDRTELKPSKDTLDHQTH